MRPPPVTVARLKTIVVITALCVALIAVPAAEAAKKKSAASSYNPRYASIVIDAQTGAVLSESNPDKALHPASLVKMMTLLMTFDGLQTGKLTLNQRIRISNHAASQAPSKLGLKPGSSITVKDAIYALVTKSANDISVALAEAIGGTEGQFVYMMNQKAREIGMTRSHFQNANGLHHVNQVSSARDMARLSRVLINQYPAQYRYFSTKNFYYNGASYHNHNRLMETYRGMDGIKTGYIQPSGFNLAASAVRGDKRVIAVVFGGRTSQSRNAHVAELLDRGFAKLGAPNASQLIANAKTVDIPARTLAALPVTEIPLPTRKPRQLTQMAANDNAAVAPAAGPTTLAAIAGEGDFDPAAATRFETGMLAIAAVKNNIAESAPAPSVPKSESSRASFNPETAFDNVDEWSIQIGAFTSRVSSDQALGDAIKRLPAPLRNTAKPVIVPLKAGDGWVFRARIRGLNREQAMASCKYFQNCMAISPRAF